jgi:hypothetical protein
LAPPSFHLSRAEEVNHGSLFEAGIHRLCGRPVQQNSFDHAVILDENNENNEN